MHPLLDNYPIGDTPLVEVDGIFAKLECVNPCGSIKDRAVVAMLTRAIERGELQPNQRIVEATSGNTGIAVAFYGRALGHPVTIVMPSNMTEERKNLIKSFGADLVLCGAGDFAEAAAIRDQLAKDNGWYSPDQFSNADNVACHRETTGAEIVAQMKGRTVDAFVAGVGTGGTLVGVGQALKAAFPNVKVFAVEPTESAVMLGGDAGVHGIYGIGDGFIPALASDGSDGLNDVIDGVEAVSTADAIIAANELSDEHQLCVGVSSGANLVAARRLKERFSTVVTIFADGFEKYSGQGLHKCPGGACAFHDRCSFPIGG